jgi:aspartate aminotransferase
MRLADRTSRLGPSVTLALSAKAKALKAEGEDVIDLTAGEPDFDTPEIVKKAAGQALQDGFTKYTAVSGTDDLKAAIIAKFERDNGLHYEKSQIIVSCGAKHSLYNISQALFESPDEVLVPTPCWVTYPDQIRLTGAKPVFIPTSESDGYQIPLGALRSGLTRHTRAILLNSPCNPTGSTYDADALREIAELVADRDLVVISDEINEPFVYDGFRHTSIASVSPEIKEKTLVVNGVSKAYAMTGWRIGYTAGPEKIIAAMTTLQSQSTSNPTSIAQKAAVTALMEGESFTQTMVAEFDRRRRFITERLNQLEGISCPIPRGAFYAFPNVSGLFTKKFRGKPLASSADVAGFLLEASKVVVVPGEPFGSSDHIRLSYAASLQDLTRAMDRIQTALGNLG